MMKISIWGCGLRVLSRVFVTAFSGAHDNSVLGVANRERTRYHTRKKRKTTNGRMS
jgi:hypothetical protein